MRILLASAPCLLGLGLLQVVGGQDAQPSAAGLLGGAGSASQLSFLQSLVKAGGLTDPMEVIRTVIDSPAMQKLYDNPEIQHRLLEANPMLAVLPGFREARGRRLSDEQTVSSFKEGVQSLAKVGGAMASNVKDPTAAFKALNELLADGGDDVKGVYLAAKEGDPDAQLQMKKLLGDKLFPGVDLDVMQQLHETKTFDDILQVPEMMHYVDQDRYLSDVFRKGVALPSKNKEAAEAAAAAAAAGAAPVGESTP